MSAQYSELHKVQFDKIFHRYHSDYNALKDMYMHDEIHNHLVYSCQQFCNETLNIYEMSKCSFYLHCIYLGKYLYHTRNTDGDERERRCKYFSYKLMLEKNNKSLKCNNVADCYSKMFKYMEDRKLRSLSDLMNCKNHDENIEDDIFQIFHELDKLYDKIKLVEWGNSSEGAQREIINIYKELSKKGHDEKISSLISALNAFKETYDMKINSCNYRNEYLRLPVYRPVKSRDNESEQLLLQVNISAKSEVTTPETQKLINHGTGDIVGMLSLTIAIISTILIMYKKNLFTSKIFFLSYGCQYTPYFSFIRQMIRKIMRMKNKKSNKQLNLINTFEHTYNNLNDNNYRIIYSSQEKH
ncbi:variable surface protein [Plasmodium gonderi]|uniref:Variable surface protein n=1 Tax=Plasmodium gonderi TaxID=77519 RepID=A0A1Y1JVP0_PLAGO|nr:variable surface protein [Plasmodium gonderi]GAW84433.1 variable surface protein [Plasmodium gonderi]